MFNVPRLATSVLRRLTNLSNNRSNRLRSAEESSLLNEQGRLIHVAELQGELLFGAAELAVRKLTTEVNEIKGMILDFVHVTSIDFSACHMR